MSIDQLNATDNKNKIFASKDSKYAISIFEVEITRSINRFYINAIRCSLNFFIDHFISFHRAINQRCKRQNLMFFETNLFS